MRNSNAWTEVDLTTLRESYAIGGMKACVAALPHRTYKAVGFKIYQLKLALPPDQRPVVNPSMQATPWDDDETQLLRDAFASGGIAKACEALPHRTKIALAKKASDLGITSHANRVQPWSDEEIAVLRKAYPAGGVRAAKVALPGRTENAIRDRAQMLGLSARVGRKKASDPIVVEKPVPIGPRARTLSELLAKAAPKVTVLTITKKTTTVFDATDQCDRGDRELLRRRMPHLFVQLGKELGRTPDAIRRLIVEMAKDGFKPDAVARLRIEPEKASESSLGSHVGVEYRFGQRPIGPTPKRGASA